MSDIYDRAQQRDAENLADALADALAAQQRRVGQTAGLALSHCEDCGEPIPAARRAAVAGCRRCINCQMLREKQKTGGRHG